MIFFANVSDPTTKCDALISYKIQFLSFLSLNVWAVLTEPRIFEQSDLFEPQGHKNVFFGRTLNAHGDRKNHSDHDRPLNETTIKTNPHWCMKVIYEN